jgi:hypothetical protein
METQRLRVGAKLMVCTEEGEREDEIVRVVSTTANEGLCIVETARNGRVVVMRGGAGKTVREAAREIAVDRYGDIPGS